MSLVTARLVLAVAASAGLAGFQHGYHTGVLNTPREVIGSWLAGTQGAGAQGEAALWAAAVAVYCVGGALGGLLSGLLADRLGRRLALALSAAPALLGAAALGGAQAANSSNLFIVGRLLVGVGSGLGAALAPLYVSEIAPVALRGALGTVYQLVLTASIVLAQALGLPPALGSASRWPLLAAPPALAALLQAASMPLCADSPRHLLLARGEDLRAQTALSWLRGDASVHAEMEEMHQEAERSKVCRRVSARALCASRALRRPLLLAMLVMAAQQLSGINAAIYFSTDIFRSVNFTNEQAQYASLGMGGMNVLATLASLALVERAGRRPLLLGGLAGMLACSLALAAAGYFAAVWWVSWLCAALVVLFVVMFALGPGAIPWFLVTELFQQAARPAATAGAGCVNWLANFIVGLAFLPLEMALGMNVFLVFAALQLGSLLYLRANLPETRGRAPEEVAAMFRQQM